MEGGEEKQEVPASGLYRPHLEQDNPNFDGSLQMQPVHELDDSQLVGAPAVVAPVAQSETLTEAKVAETNAGKRKRGRPPRGLAKPPPAKKKKDEEDVCFICFDGGELVLCDRR